MDSVNLKASTRQEWMPFWENNVNVTKFVHIRSFYSANISFINVSLNIESV
jgi:hypothetical protein